MQLAAPPVLPVGKDCIIYLKFCQLPGWWGLAIVLHIYYIYHTIYHWVYNLVYHLVDHWGLGLFWVALFVWGCERRCAHWVAHSIWLLLGSSLTYPDWVAASNLVAGNS